MKKLLPFLVIIALAISCSKDDPCVCENGGTCVNDVCVCTEGYEGANCSTQSTPSKIFVSKIDFLTFPATRPGGNAWDDDSHPDLLAIFWNETDDDFVYEMPEAKENAAPGVIHTYVLPMPVIINDATDSHSIGLYEFDGFTANEYMGGVIFTPNNVIDDFPETITLSAGNISFKLYVTYQF